MSLSEYTTRIGYCLFLNTIQNMLALAAVSLLQWIEIWFKKIKQNQLILFRISHMWRTD